MARIGLDAMGGDYAPDVIIRAVNGLEPPPFELVLVGDENLLKDRVPTWVKLYHTEQVIGMDEHPLDAIRKKPNSSIVMGMELQKRGELDAFVGFGNSGAYMVAAVTKLGRLKGIKRPALATFFPTIKGYTLVLDVGANVDAEPIHLYQFAMMASIYLERALGIDNPSIGLVSMGEEDIKGGEKIMEAHRLLKESGLNFYGNIDAHQILYGVVDIVVCSGAIGNAILKFGESLVEIIADILRSSINRSIFTKLAGAMLAPSLKKSFGRLNYERYGGAILMGVKGVNVIGHGRSKEPAIQNALFTAYKYVKEAVNENIEEAIHSVAG